MQKKRKGDNLSLVKMVHGVTICFQNMVQLETIVRVLEEERDYYKKEYEVIKALKRSSSSARATPTKVRETTL